MPTRANAGWTRWQRIVYRAVFFLLSVWVHCAILFFVTMDLFAGSDANSPTQQRTDAKQPAIVKVELTPPRREPDAAMTDTKPSQSTDAQSSEEKPSSMLEQIQPQPQIQESLKPSEKSQKPTPKDGILNCDSLTQKPQRIELGTGELDASLGGDNRRGSLVLHISIHRDGSVLGVTVERSTVDKKMENAIVDYAYRSLFTPGELNGIPVDCDMKYEIVPE